MWSAENERSNLIRCTTYGDAIVNRMYCSIGCVALLLRADYYHLV